MKKKHAEVIKAWADGAAIQHRAPNSTEWKDNDDPMWAEDYEYRVKPAREYPETRMDGYELSLALLGLPPASNITAGYTAIANATLRHAIDNGQVVTREEFDRLAASIMVEREVTADATLMAVVNMLREKKSDYLADIVESALREAKSIVRAGK